MATVITLATTKGGAGKTTLSASLASYWHRHDISVGVVDGDPNANLTRWLSKGELNEIPHQSEPDESAIIDAVDAMAEECDIVIVDIAGFGNQAMVYAIGVSSLVLIPAKPSEDDVLEAVKTKRFVENAARLTKRDIPYRVVITQARDGTRVLEHTKAQFQAFNVPVFETVIALRTSYQTSRFHGTTPIYAEPKGLASKEIRSLAVDIEKCINISTNIMKAV